ncbi:MAG TPA: aldo/keto reductase [Solirubrobacteraceae bacterium]|jgi:aryl-alcohol dehydrogenase-like predicted oxidoreductase|nr:aldo/keto reductase [Solirubrobacteraceae bacterium]
MARSRPHDISRCSDGVTTFAIGGETEVRRLGFGAMRITGEGTWGPPADPGAAVALLRRAVELGVEFIDTADAYGPYVSEDLIAAALYPYDGLVIATKGGYERTGPSGRSDAGRLLGWSVNGRPEHLRAACEGSLRRLKVDRIDLYQLHWPDPDVPLEESIGAIGELRQEGKVRYVGVCNVTVEELAIARSIVEIATVQSPFNLADTTRADLLAECEAHGIGFIPYRPLQGGQLAEAGGAVASAAKRHGATPGQVALAWLLARSPAILPIPGTASPAHLEANVAAASLCLDDEEVLAIASALS